MRFTITFHDRTQIEVEADDYDQALETAVTLALEQNFLSTELYAVTPHYDHQHAPNGRQHLRVSPS